MSAAKSKPALRFQRWILFGILSLWMHDMLWSQVYPVRSGRKWGLINAEGTLLSQPDYDAVTIVDDGFALVVRGGKYGLCNPEGKLVIPTNYTFIEHFLHGLWAINQGGDCEEGSCKGGKWGLYDIPSGNLLPPTYELIQQLEYSQPYLIANAGGECDYWDCKGGKWALIDSSAKVILPAEFDSLDPQLGQITFTRNAQGWGLFDLKGMQQVIPSIYERLYFVRPGWLYGVRGGNASLLKPDGQVVIQGRHTGYRDAGEGYFSFSQGNAWGLCDSTGREIIPARYDLVEVQAHGWVRLWSQGSLGIGRVSGRICSGNVFGMHGALGPGYMVVSQGLAWGVIDTAGKEILPVRYEGIRVSSDSIFIVQERQIMRWVGLDGKVRKGIGFEVFEAFDGPVAKVTAAKKRGLINTEGDWIVKPQYDELHVLQYVAQARVRGGEWEYFYFDEQGRPSQVKRLILRRDESATPQVDLIGVSWNGSGTSPQGWFLGGDRLWGLRNPSTNRILIQPKYTDIQLIPGTNLTLVEGKIGNSEDTGFGIVNHGAGKETIPPILGDVILEDFVHGGVARATYAGSAKYTLIRKNGENVGLEGVVYIRPFAEGVTAVNVGGSFMETEVLKIDTIGMYKRPQPNTRDSTRIYRYCVGGKWGYVDSMGKWLQVPAYEQALSFDNKLARIKLNGKWGVVNAQFATVVTPAYDFIQVLHKSEKNTLYTVGHDVARFGFIDTLGEVVVVPKFTEAGTYHEGLACVRVDGLWGFADMQGQTVIPPRYKEVGDFHEGRARVRNGRKWGYIDAQGNAITPEKYLRAGDFHEGRAWVQDAGGFGFLGLDGTLAIPAQYTKCQDFSHGVAVVQQRGNMGLVDSLGKWVLPARYYRIQAFKDSIAVIQSGADHGIARPDGRIIVKPRYRAIQDYSQGLAAFRSGLEYGYIDTAGQVIIPPAYANAGPFHCGRAAVFQNGRWGFIDLSGLMVIEPRYQATGAFSEDRAAVRLGKRWGFIDREGKLVIPASFDKVGSFENGRAAVYTSGQGWGFVNSDGTLVVPCEYDQVGKFKNGIVPVCKNRKWGVLNQYGSLLTLMKYDQIGNYDQGLAKVKVDRQIGIVNASGEVLLSPEYDSIEMLDAIIQVESNDRLGYLSTQGRWLWQPSK